MSAHDQQSSGQKITEVLPKAGLVYSEKGNLTEVLCKPKIMPLKSVTLERIEEMERQAAQLSETMAAQERERTAKEGGVSPAVNRPRARRRERDPAYPRASSPTVV